MTFAAQTNVMKKTALLLSLVAGASIATNAQVTLTGTTYSQNFNSLASGLPTGWTCYVSASSSAAGTLSPFDGNVNYGLYADTVQGGGACTAEIRDGAFKSFPSANVATKASTCSEQKLVTDRALGVRQTGASFPGADPGAAFVFKIANTTGRSAFQLSFKMQSLDTTSPRTTTWIVDYGIGATPTSFTPAVTSPASLVTGNYVFSNTPVSVNFGSDLDNKSSAVWIRIAALTASSGSGTRTASAIDDFSLTWTGSVGVYDISANPNASLNVYGAATNSKVTFGYNVAEGGDYALSIHDITGRNVYNGNFTAGEAGTHTVNGLNLASGFYVARMSNGNSTAVTKFTVN